MVSAYQRPKNFEHGIGDMERLETELNPTQDLIGHWNSQVIHPHFFSVRDHGPEAPVEFLNNYL